MKLLLKSLKTGIAGCALILFAVPIFAADTDKAAKKEDAHGPREDVQEAVQVIQRMQSDTEVNQLLERASGVFVIPDYAAAALIVGGAGGEGVLIPKTNNEWGHPAFYDVGSISAGIQAGVEAGSIAMILLSDEALQSFNQENNFSLNADAGLSVVNWSAKTRAQAGIEGDVVVWADTEGLFGELAVSVSDVNWDNDENTAYYGEEITAEQILSGNIPATRKQELGQVSQ